MQETELQKECRETMESCLDMMNHIDKADSMLFDVIWAQIQPLLDKHQYTEARAAVKEFYKPCAELVPFLGIGTASVRIHNLEKRHKAQIGESSLTVNGYIILLDKPSKKFYVYLGHRTTPLKSFDSLEGAEEFCKTLKSNS